MPYLPTAQAFLEQAALLIAAQPSTARISTKYNVPHPSPPPTLYRPSSARSDVTDTTMDTTTDTTVTSRPGRHRIEKAKTASLTLKCYDPASGTCLKYRTDKQAEVGRLISGLGRCGHVMAGLPPKAAEEPKPEIKTDSVLSGQHNDQLGPAEGKAKEAQKDIKPSTQNQGAGGAGKKKKKKGGR